MEEDLLGLIYVVIVEKRRVECLLDGLCHTSLALSESGTHDRHPTIGEDGLDILIVKSHLAVHGDDFRDALGCIAERVVRNGKRLGHGLSLIDLVETLVVDHEERIDVLVDFVHTVECLVDFSLALPFERYSHDSHGEDVHLARHPGNDRSGTRACSTTHTSGDEHHLGSVVEHRPDLRYALLSRLSRLLRPVAGSKSFAELELVRHRRVVERFLIGVAHCECDIVDARVVHVVDRVAATSTYADHLDDALHIALESEWKSGVGVSIVCIVLICKLPEVEVEIHYILVCHNDMFMGFLNTIHPLR